MSRNKQAPLSAEAEISKIKAALLSLGQTDHEKSRSADSYNESLDCRVRKLLGIVEQHKKINGRMLFFVMYDIESNKVRSLIHKYLKRMGCTPIQRSIFLADAPVETYERIKKDLAEVQESYDNDDSIMVLPVSTDYLRMMKIIGHHIEVDVITHTRNTLFF